MRLLVENEYMAQYLHHYFFAATFSVGEYVESDDYHYTPDPFRRWMRQQQLLGRFTELTVFPISRTSRELLGIRCPTEDSQLPTHKADITPLPLPG